MSSSSELTHLNAQGQAHMVDVTQKASTKRKAVATARVFMEDRTSDAISEGKVPKGDVLAVARIAGIMAAKRTADIIPLCHPLPLTGVEVNVEVGVGQVFIEAQVSTKGVTGVEMEALSAVSAAALTIYDMCKALDRSMVISQISLKHKEGGRTGTYHREESSS